MLVQFEVRAPALLERQPQAPRELDGAAASRLPEAIIMNQNVPADCSSTPSESRFFNQYCPGQTMGLWRPNELGGTDLTHAFVNR